MSDFKVEVRDYHNPRRLLGHIHNPPMAHSPHVRYAVLPKLSTAVPIAAEATQPVDIKTVELEIVWDAVTKQAVFQTSTPLEDLMTLRQFTLPGEGELQAHNRRMYS